MAVSKKDRSSSPLIIIAFSLFWALIVAVTVSTTIPFGQLLFNPNTLHDNVAVSTVALTVGAFLPMLVGYVLGYVYTKAKDKQVRRLNGVLFGLLAFWVTTLLNGFISLPSEMFGDSPNVRLILMNTVPSVVVTILTILLGIFYRRSAQSGKSLITYRPYGGFLIALLLLLPIVSIATSVLYNDINGYAFVDFVVIAILGTISYATLAKSKLSQNSRLVWSAISVAVALASASVVSQLSIGIATFVLATPTMEIQTVEAIAAAVLSFAVWIMYWVVQSRALTK